MEGDLLAGAMEARIGGPGVGQNEDGEEFVEKVEGFSELEAEADVAGAVEARFLRGGKKHRPVARLQLLQNAREHARQASLSRRKHQKRKR